MFHPLSLSLGLRYTRSRRQHHFISFISVFSVLGIALGVMALITVLSVMNGFHHEIRERILGMTAHGDIRTWQGRLDNWPEVHEQAAQHPQVLAAAPYIETQAMLMQQRQVTGALVRGILPTLESDVVNLTDAMQVGQLTQLQPGAYHIILGAELAARLGARLGDKVTVLVPQTTTTIVGSRPRMKRFTLVGLFAVGMAEYDSGIALIHQQDAARLLRMEDQVSGVRIRLDDGWAAPAVSQELAQQLGNAYRLLNWTDYHRNFFAALQMEKRMLGLLLFLIVLIGAFTIVTTLVMVVMDKRSDIAILKTLGATPGLVWRIFVVQGATLGAIGTLLGGGLGLLLATHVEAVVAQVETWLGIHFIDPGVYYISHLPSQVQAGDVWLVTLGAFILSVLMTLYPAWRAWRIEPATALRYE
ncbi:MAG: lipoprotein-releasing ABC transporter permease subunit [Pseudomonadota bacterium]